jgi:hypothetical protein
MAAAETAARLSCQERKVAMVRRLAGCRDHQVIHAIHMQGSSCRTLGTMP